MEEKETALSFRPGSPIPVDNLPSPVFDGKAMGRAINQYRELQSALDASMPDSVMTIRGKSFRKKSYWRAVATAFNLDVWMLGEERVEEGDDWGYAVTYRAKAPSGKIADGDGGCMRSEKVSEKYGDKQATLHNIRSHAHTRAFNRAVSNLVGFGEVSADELNEDGEVVKAKPKPRKKQEEDPDFDVESARRDLSNTIMKMVNGDKQKAAELLQQCTANEKKGFDGFKTTKYMKHRWQFDQAWARLGEITTPNKAEDIFGADESE